MRMAIVTVVAAAAVAVAVFVVFEVVVLYGKGSQRRKSTPDTPPNRHNAEYFCSCHTAELPCCHKVKIV